MDDTPEFLVSLGLRLVSENRLPAAAQVAQRLASAPDGPVRLLLEERAVAALRSAWRRGWMPDELVWRVSRSYPDLEGLVRLAVAGDAAGWTGEPFHPRWRTVLDGLGLPVAGVGGWCEEDVWRRGEGWHATIGAVLRLVAVVQDLPAVGLIVPPPGGADLPGAVEAARNACAWVDGLGADDAVLTRIRRLLAQAESTTFPEEAATFTAKAHELAARHALDLAAVWAEGRSRGLRVDRPVTIRVRIDDPYASSKDALLQTVARCSRCRAVRHRGAGLTSVVGFPNDLRATEMLFTSLLLQSQAELESIARRSSPGSRERTRGYRSSFLMGYAARIGERLSRVSAVVLAGDDGAALASALPALAQRTAEVDDVVAAQFQTERRRRSVADAAGLVSGRDAADRADLDHRRLGGERRGLGIPSS